MRLTLSLVFLVLASPVLADEPIVEACKRAVAISRNVETVYVGQVQVVTELSPASVSMRYSLSKHGDGDKIAAMLGSAKKSQPPVYNKSARCEFDNTSPPFSLSSLCGVLCIEGRRLDELKIIMRSEGL